MPTLVLALLLSACGVDLSSASEVTLTPFIITSTLPSTPVPPPSLTPLPPTAPPTRTPVAGTTSTQLNVRGDPSTTSAPLGLLAPFTKVQIIAKDSSGTWYEILYSQGPDGTGWIVAQYVQADAPSAIPVVAEAASPTPTAPTSESIPNASADSTITAQPQESIASAAPTGLPATLTPVPIPAPPDGDSPQSPAVKVAFLPGGTRSLIFSSDVSIPEGDREDWIQFIPYGSSVNLGLVCSGNGMLKLSLSENGTPVPGWSGPDCGQVEKSTVAPGQTYLMGLSAVATGSQLAYVHYTISIATPP